MIKTITAIILGFLYLALADPAKAVCPVCTVAVVGGLGLSRFLGIDDSISGIWIGGIILSSSLWFSDWIKKKYGDKLSKKVTHNLDFLSSILTYLLVFVPLAYTKVLGHPLNTLWGIDKIVLGTIIGSTLFLVAIWVDKKVRRVKGKQLFVYQKVAFPISLLIVGSVVFYFLTKNL